MLSSPKEMLLNPIQAEGHQMVHCYSQSSALIIMLYGFQQQATRVLATQRDHKHYQKPFAEGH